MHSDVDARAIVALKSQASKTLHLLWLSMLLPTLLTKFFVVVTTKFDVYKYERIFQFVMTHYVHEKATFQYPVGQKCF